MKIRTPHWTRILPGILTILLVLSASSAMAVERSLSFAVRGVIASVLVTPGDKVSKGTALAKLDTTLHAARVASSATVLKSAVADLDKAMADLDRTQQLYDDLSASGENLEMAKMTLTKAEAAHARANSRAIHSQWVLGRATLKSPFAGVVSSVPGYPGMVVNPRAENPPVAVINAQ